MKAREVLDEYHDVILDLRDLGTEEYISGVDKAENQALLALKEMVLKKKKEIALSVPNYLKDIHNDRKLWNRAVESVAKLFEEEKG